MEALESAKLACSPGHGSCPFSVVVQVVRPVVFSHQFDTLGHSPGESENFFEASKTSRAPRVQGSWGSHVPQSASIVSTDAGATNSGLQRFSATMADYVSDSGFFWS